jgi:hypothetical protein
MRSWTLLSTFCFLALSPTLAAQSPEKFEWRDGDRVVLIGDTLIERDQKYGYLEAIITSQNPDKTITFRNLGWSGDTVRGLSRARFGPPSEGWEHLKSHVLALKPTVLIVGYGMAESFDGEHGLPSFISGYKALLDTFAPLKPRLVLLSPIRHEDLGRPLPNPAKHNASIEKYRDAIKAVAKDRQAWFVDLADQSQFLTLVDQLKPLTDDGIHVNAVGSWVLAIQAAGALGMRDDHANATIDGNGTVTFETGVVVQGVKIDKNGLRFEATVSVLPLCRPPAGSPDVISPLLDPRVRVSGFEAADFHMSIDGKAPTNPVDLKEFRGTIRLRGPDHDQTEALRRTINEKNLLYFYRWRPQNETYLFGFRKHEQGNNAREIPLFDPLVEAKEKEIARLKKPVYHVYDLTRK